MKLLLKRQPENGLYVLCNEAGEILPAQTRVTLVSEPGEQQMLHVTFYCDGESIKVVGDGDS